MGKVGVNDVCSTRDWALTITLTTGNVFKGANGVRCAPTKRLSDGSRNA